ncbi:uncharacterized protein [Nicotiana sylvestris]|uniref:uncharacterized protein n=1 Tax=Nicotiana sylvestris TaxID=4096 RepID=UPI00388C731C
MKNNKASKKSPKKSAVADIPSFDLGVLSPKSPKKQGKSPHAIAETTHSSSPQQIRAEMGTKQKHDVDAGETSTPVKQVKRKGKEIFVDDDFVEEVPNLRTGKKAKVSPSSKNLKMKKHSKKHPKIVQNQSLAKLKGETLNFGLREFALITGLRCVTQVTDFGYNPTYVSKIMSSYFRNKLRVEKSYLKQIVTTTSWVNDEDAVKLCILYLLEFFICPSDKDHVSFVDHFRFYLVESGQYESYPWGIKSFTQMMESVRHRLNPYLHSYLIRGCSLALQVWLYECCSTVSTDLATRCSNSIPRILRWSATKRQIWLTAFEEKMIKPEWIKFTNIVESGEEIAVLILPDKIEYKVQEGEQTSEVPNADPRWNPNKQMEKRIRSLLLRRSVDKKLEDFTKSIFVELDSLRVFINDSVQSVLQMINIRNVQNDAKFNKNNDQQKDLNNQHFQFNIGEQVQESTSKIEHVEGAVGQENLPAHGDLYTHFQVAVDENKAVTEDINAQFPIHGVTVAAQPEQVIEEHDNEGADAQRKAPFSIKDNQIKPWLDLGVEKVDKKEWFFSLHINVIMYYLRKRGKYSPNNKTRFTTTDCVFKTRIEQIYEKFINSPPQEKYSVVKPQDVVAEYILGYRLLANVAWDEIDYVIMPVNIKEKFHWVLVVIDIADMQLYAYDSMVSSHNHHVVESCVEKFSVIIPLYLSCTGFYGKRKDINFMNTKAYIEKPVIDPLNIQWMVAEIPQQKEGSLDCGVFVAAFAEYVSLGDLSISAEDLSDIDQHRRRYGALLWDYATKKQEDGSISESEVTCRLARRKGAPTLNEKTRVQRKKK